MAVFKNIRISPAQIILLGFLALILVGALLLTLPIATNDGMGASFFDALFTATSATCVTGLVVRDTALYWSGFGQAVILLLIQIGGMGVVTVAVSFIMFSGRKISLKQRWVMQESISAPQMGGILRMTGFILKASVAMESVGALCLALRFCRQFGFLRGIWYAVFHAVSAFCNAGFDLMGRHSGAFSSLTAYENDPFVVAVISLLIILGGIGFLTWEDVRTHGVHVTRYHLQTKLVLCTTAALLLGSFLFFAAYEFCQPQWSSLSFGQRLLAAAFAAVSPRTAGFNTVDLAQLSASGVLVTIVLMLAGGAPGSTAGGFKVTTLSVLLLNMRAVFRRNAHTQCFGRRLADDVVSRAAALVTLYLVLFLCGGMTIAIADRISLGTALFTAASAIGTVGLAVSPIGELCAVSRLVLIFLMYFGRVGGLTMIFAISSGKRYAAVQFPMEQVTIG